MKEYEKAATEFVACHEKTCPPHEVRMFKDLFCEGVEWAIAQLRSEEGRMAWVRGPDEMSHSDFADWLEREAQK